MFYLKIEIEKEIHGAIFIFVVDKIWLPIAWIIFHVIRAVLFSILNKYHF